MHQVFFETTCPLEAFQLHYCPDNDAKSMVKHYIFLQKVVVIPIIVPRAWIAWTMVVSLMSHRLCHVSIYLNKFAIHNDKQNNEQQHS